jgi:DNA mismatch repair protein MutS
MTEKPEMIREAGSIVEDTYGGPADRRYRGFKERYPNYILLFRIGDFYEAFHEDAQILSDVLGLPLTSRKDDSSTIPMAGVLCHVLDSSLSRLLRAGHRCAIIEPATDQPTKGQER